MSARRADELKTSPQLTLGEIILKLESVTNKELPLYIGEKRPMGLDSWRGSYDELAIQTESFGSYQTSEVEKTFSDMVFYKSKNFGKKNPNVSEFISILKEAVGKTFTGYKGGDFLMSKNTPVWFAEYGMASDEYFVEVKETKAKVKLIIAKGEY